MKRTILILIICLFHLYGHAQNWEQIGMGSISIDIMYGDTVNNFLYAAGNFYTANGDTIRGIAKWNGIKWDSLGPGIDNGYVITMETYNNELFVSGFFSLPGGIENTAKWNGSFWDSVGCCTNAAVDLLTFNNELYAVGTFTIGGITTKLAKWNGVKWDSVGSPSTYTWYGSGAMNALGSFNGDIFVGGPLWSGFSIEGIPKMGVTRFDGSTWQGLNPYGIHKSSSCPTGVYAFQVYNNELYIGGCFLKEDPITWSNGNIDNNIVRWAGDSLQEVGGGVNDKIFDLAVFNNELYAVGDFWQAGGVPAAYIAKWDGTQWCGLGSQFNGPVWAIEVFNDELYIGGSFTSIDGNTVNHVAKWVGGNYVDTCGVLLSTNNPLPPVIKEITISPNPTTGTITITNLPRQASNITIYNIFGQAVFQTQMPEQQSESDNYWFDLSNHPNGIYFLFASSNAQRYVMKIMKM